jgi:integrase
MNRLGRSLSPGKLERVQRGNGPPRWVATWTDASGQRRRQALSTDKLVAQRKLNAIIRERDLELVGLGTESGQERLLGELKTLYISDLAVTAVPRHVKQVAAHLEGTFEATGAVRVGDLVPHKLMRHRAELLAAGRAVRTANVRIACLRAMMRWCVQAGFIGADPLARLKQLPEHESTQRRRRRALSEEEIDAFMAAVRADDRACSAHHPRVPQAPLFAAFLETGARYGELTATSWHDVDLERGMLRLRAETTKARKERSIPLRDEMVAALRNLRDAQVAVLRRPLNPRDRVFLSPEGKPWPWHSVNLMRIFVRTLEAAGIDRVDDAGRQLDLHALRHTLATRLARSGVGLVQAQRILGHADPKLTARIYSHLEPEDLRDAIEQIGRNKTKSNTEKAAV